MIKVWQKLECSDITFFFLRALAYPSLGSEWTVPTHLRNMIEEYGSIEFLYDRIESIWVALSKLPACLVTLQKKVVYAWWNFPAKWLTICHLIHTKSLLKKQLGGFIVRIHKILLVWEIVKCFTGSFLPSINLFNSEECSVY